MDRKKILIRYLDDHDSVDYCKGIKFVVDRDSADCVDNRKGGLRISVVGLLSW